MPNQSSQNAQNSCIKAAMQLLAGREHSVKELKQKLNRFNEKDVEQTIAKLIVQNYQSDARFAAEFVQMRFNQGKGSVKIMLELKQRGIEDFDLSPFDFFELAKHVRLKKFGEHIPKNYQEKAKQQRFLQSRGFGFDEIQFISK